MTPDALAYALTPEWFRAVSTGLPLLVLAAWIPVAMGALWRRSLWRARGAELTRMAADGGALRAVRWGYALRRGDVDVVFTGGLRGPRTDVRRGRILLERRDGWAPVDEVGRWLAAHGAA